jgi:hypothetical protein
MAPVGSGRRHGFVLVASLAADKSQFMPTGMMPELEGITS